MDNRCLKENQQRYLVMEKAVIQYDLEGNIITEWDSVAQATRALNLGTNIYKCAEGTQTTAYGFIWKYKGE